MAGLAIRKKVREIRAPDAGTPRSALKPDGAARLTRAAPRYTSRTALETAAAKRVPGEPFR